MKRIIVLLSIVMIFMTGCSVTKLDNSNISKNMKILLSKKVKLYNVFYDGYKYFLHTQDVHCRFFCPLLKCCL